MTTKTGTKIEILQDLGAGQYLCSVLSKHGTYTTQVAAIDIVGMEPQQEPKLTPMSMQDIAERLEEIKRRAQSDDPESAHGEEDELYESFIKHVKAFPNDPQLEQKAGLVLSSSQISFPRWCA